MSTRAGAAAFSLRAKQELVKRLFGPKLMRKGPESHRLLDHSIYTYDDLRSAYLEQVKLLHPDKHNARNISVAEKDENKRQFVCLQEAWTKYEEIAKVTNRVSNGKDAAANFTMFGVGCSFSDSEDEKNMRANITDQACRGWFSAGAISHGNRNEKSGKFTAASQTTAPLVDDDLFSVQGEASSYFEGQGDAAKEPKPSLVSHLIRPARNNE